MPKAAEAAGCGSVWLLPQSRLAAVLMAIPFIAQTSAVLHSVPPSVVRLNSSSNGRTINSPRSNIRARMSVLHNRLRSLPRPSRILPQKYRSRLHQMAQHAIAVLISTTHNNSSCPSPSGEGYFRSYCYTFHFLL